MAAAPVRLAPADPPAGAGAGVESGRPASADPEGLRLGAGRQRLLARAPAALAQRPSQRTAVRDAVRGLTPGDPSRCRTDADVIHPLVLESSRRSPGFTAAHREHGQHHRGPDRHPPTPSRRARRVAIPFPRAGSRPTSSTRSPARAWSTSSSRRQCSVRRTRRAGQRAGAVRGHRRGDRQAKLLRQRPVGAGPVS
jgi:hypothetical protein